MDTHLHDNMRAVQFERYGMPLDVLQMNETSIPVPGPNQVRIKVHACAINPADAALCQGFMGSGFPRGIGLDVSGTVVAVGPGCNGVAIGAKVFGVPDFMNQVSAGLADHAVLSVWEPVPAGLMLEHAAALPMVVETATRTLDLLGVTAGQTILIHGAGTMVGFSAVQIAILRGAKVIATAGPTFEKQLASFGARVTSYKGEMFERVSTLAEGSIDYALQTAYASGKLADLIRLVGGDPLRVMSVGDLDAKDYGVRTSGSEPDLVPRYDVLAHYAGLAAERKFFIPIAQTFPFTQWREATKLSLGGQAHGKLLILP